ncbi:transposase [Escherichia coli]|uniref:Transposase n=1 Tax=Escherichia coli TaxID=562 RepID=A0AAI9B563_ECOLX|nr:transposase [Escherichia coli]HDQ6533020.1 transposase [Escherichia coli O36:H14]ANO87289.1 transposase [Escherichia coli]EFI6951906.1 transposase [Escherichia coli]EFN1899494.1 transposase [Escherichia coli]EHR9385272.1 transposase [Escherichia coli]
MDIKTRRETRQTLAQWFEDKGRQEVRQECALRLLSKGMLREDVAEMANLSLDKLIN